MLDPVPFGPTGDVMVSAVGLGTAAVGNEYGQMTDNDATTLIRYAFEQGITYFDTSAYYGRGTSEQRLGKAIAPFRDQVFLATKGGRLDRDPDTGFDFSFDAILQHCTASLERLNVDHVDLYQLHDIEFGRRDVVTQDGLAALHEIRRQGKARFIGITGYPTTLLADIADQAGIDSVLSYCRYNLLDRSLAQRLAPVTKARNISLINASILHMGLLSPNGPQPWHPAPHAIRHAARRAIAVCEAAGISTADLSTAFAVSNPDIAVTLLGSNRPETLDQSLAARHMTLDDELLAAIDIAIGEDLNLAWASGRQENHEPDAIPTRDPQADNDH